MEIQWVHVEDVEDADRGAVEERLEALAEGYSDLIDIRITARSTEHHKHGGREVSIAGRARGRDIVARRLRPDLGLALHDALDAFEHEVREMRVRRRDRRAQQAATPPLLGIVDRVLVDDGYGFILTDAGDRVYFHRNAVQSGLDFATLDEGQRVGLNLEAGAEGLQATAVVPPPPDASTP